MLQPIQFKKKTIVPHFIHNKPRSFRLTDFIRTVAKINNNTQLHSVEGMMQFLLYIKDSSVRINSYSNKELIV